MNTLLVLPLALIGLSGCVAYTPHGYGEPYGSYGYSGPSVYVQPGYGYAHPVYPGRGRRDLDGDGRPNRFDPDRDGDGIANRNDRRPNDPRRR